MYPKNIKNLIECFKSLPGIGEKSAERLVFSMLDFSEERLSLFSDSIISIKNNITKCPICNYICENGKCLICDDNSRDSETIFVVEKLKDIISFERMNVYKGMYHVLGGLISPMDGKGPEDLTINLLIDRIKNDNIKEVVFALKPNIEGETTMQYIKRLLDNYDVNVTKIATGIPIGTDIEYIDPMTLEFAFEDRKRIT